MAYNFATKNLTECAKEGATKGGERGTGSTW